MNFQKLQANIFEKKVCPYVITLEDDSNEDYEETSHMLKDFKRVHERTLYTCQNFTFPI